jgi:hypothetical protein
MSPSMKKDTFHPGRIPYIKDMKLVYYYYRYNVAYDVKAD